MLIGISGKIGSGKDTVAGLIVHYSAEDWEIRGFADRLKLTVAALTNTTVEENYSRKGKQFQPPGFSHSLGVLQQKVGMALREHIDPNIWMNIALENTTNKFVIVADVRFQNEAEAIRNRGGMVIRVNGDPTHCRENDSRSHQHPSETELDHWPHFDWVIENSGTLEELSQHVQSWITRIMHPECMQENNM